MVIKRIEISHLGQLTNFAAEFDSQLVVLPKEYGAAVLSAVHAVLSDQYCDMHLKNGNFCDGTKICADVRMYDENYRISISVSPNRTRMLTEIFGENAGIAPKDYYRSVHQTPEENRLNWFTPKPEIPYSECLKAYKDPDAFYGKDVFARITEGVGRTDSFRVYLKNFIKKYEPQRFSDAHGIYIMLQNNGTFTAEYADASKRNICLTGEEQLRFEFLCFLTVNRFWNDMETMRDLNHIRKPLFAKGSSKTKETVCEFLSHKEGLDRQLFFLTI